MGTAGHVAHHYSTQANHFYTERLIQSHVGLRVGPRFDPCIDQQLEYDRLAMVTYCTVIS